MRTFRMGVLVLLLGGLTITPERPAPPPLPGFMYRVVVLSSVTVKTPLSHRRTKTENTISEHQGSTFAVSSDGMLMTTRHVIDLGFWQPAVCEPTVSVEDIAVRLDVYDMYGNHWSGRARGDEPHGSPCDLFGNAYLRWESESTATVVALGNTVDLGLIRIRAGRLAHVQLDHHIQVPQEDWVIALGWSRGELTISPGIVQESCVQLRDYDVRLKTDDPIMVTSAQTTRGMSGGPMLYGNALAGVITRNASGISVGVSGAYAARWYEWVRGGQYGPPPDTTCPGW